MNIKYLEIYTKRALILFICIIITGCSPTHFGTTVYSPGDKFDFSDSYIYVGNITDSDINQEYKIMEVYNYKTDTTWYAEFTQNSVVILPNTEDSFLVVDFDEGEDTINIKVLK